MSGLTIAVIGLGYIGLPTAVVLARAGSNVIGVDVSDRHIDLINQGKLPFVEEGLEEALAEVVTNGSLRAQKETPPADAYIVAVPTPFKQGSHEADLSYIKDSAAKIAPQLYGDALVILESTSPPGTTEKMAEFILAERPDLSLDGSDGRPVVHFAHAPERVLPGRIMVEMVANDRIIGGMTPAASEKARDVYATFCEGELVLTDAKTAEMSKLTENAFRDVNIAFANELSILCEQMGIDVWELIDLANRHPRVNILQPGPGVGGHCIAVDPWFIVHAAPDFSNLIRTAREVNDRKPDYVIRQVEAVISEHPGEPVALLGLTFKPNIDDLRQSPALGIVRELAQRLTEADLRVVEPNIAALPSVLEGKKNVRMQNVQEAISESRIVVLLVDHSQFKKIGNEDLAGKKVIDTRGVWRSGAEARQSKLDGDAADDEARGFHLQEAPSALRIL